MTLSYLHGIETIEQDNGIRPIQTVKSSVIGLVGTAPDADNTKFPLDEPVHILGDPTQVADLGATGTLADAMDGIFDHVGASVVMVRVAEGTDFDATLSNVVGASGSQTGVHALKAAKSHVGVQPMIYPGFGFSSQRPGDAANPLISELLGIVDRRRGAIIADGTNTTKEAALEHAGDWGSDRIYMVDPAVKAFKGGQTLIEPSSARAAGLIAKTDLEDGFWHSPSNRVVQGITGAARTIDHDFSDTNTEANFLNENKIATIIRSNGFRLWGNKTLATDPLWQFLSVRRTADMVYESIENAHIWALDKPLSIQLMVDVAESVNAYLRILKQRGAIIGGRAWIDENLNPAAQLKAGQYMVSFDIEPPAPMERLTFVAYRNDNYYTEMTEQAAAQLALRIAA